MSRMNIVLLVCLTASIPSVADEPKPQLLHVITPVDSIYQIVPDGDRVWLATRGGAVEVDARTQRRKVHTRHDGMAMNHVGAIRLHDGAVYAFTGWTNQVSILDRGAAQWRVVQLGDKLQRGFYGFPWACPQVRDDGIWCVFTGVPDQEFGGINACILQQYDAKTGRLKRQIPLRPDGGEPDGKFLDTRLVGLHLDGATAVVVLDRELLKADLDKGAVLKIPLPETAVFTVGSTTYPNTIASMTAGDGFLWLGMEKGLARFDLKGQAFEFVYQDVQPEIRRPSGMVHLDGGLWMATDNPALRRLDLKTGQLTTVAPDILVLSDFAFIGGRIWACSPEYARPGLLQIDPQTGKHTRTEMAGLHQIERPIHFTEHLLCVAGYRFEYVDGRQVTHEGIEVYDLFKKSGDFIHVGDKPLIVPQKDRVWLITSGKAVALDPFTRKLDKPIGPGGAWDQYNPPTIEARRGGVLYLQTSECRGEGNNEQHRRRLLRFDPAKGELELLAVIPDAWRSHNAEVCGVTSKHLFLSYSDDGEVFKRLDLKTKQWSDAPKHKERKPRVTEALGRVWWTAGGRIEGRSADGRDRPVAFTIDGDWIMRLEEVDGCLEVVTSAATFRTDGVTWTARPNPRTAEVIPCVDRTGRNAGTWLMRTQSGSTELAIWQGFPSGYGPRPDEWKPVRVTQGVMRIQDVIGETPP